MKLFGLVAAWLLSSPLVEAIDLQAWLQRTNKYHDKNTDSSAQNQPIRIRDAPQQPFFLNDKSKKYAVDGKNIPDVPGDVGEAYAGLMPIQYGNEIQSDGQLFFWFSPTTNQTRPKEILIWLNGGPGCSSLIGLMQENGPFLWQTGTHGPVLNPWSWHHITNVIWVEQPVQTGFSTGTVTATSEYDVAKQFMGFWKNFVDTFGMHGYKVYISGESFAGDYCPYIASEMLKTNNVDYFDVRGMHLIDPVIGDFSVSEYIPTYDFYQAWKTHFSFNTSFQQRLDDMNQKCGYNDFLNKYLVFPAAGLQPTDALPGPNKTNDCDIVNDLAEAALNIDPGYNMYQVEALTPVPFDPLGFPSLFRYMPPGTQPYFNRTDVKRAIHAPLDVDWRVCTDNNVFVNGTITNDFSIISAIPHVLERTHNVIISQGQNDMILIDAGVLMNIQNMTWDNQLGFSCRPEAPLFVPFHDQANDFNNVSGTGIQTLAGMGVLGTTHTERGLTWNQVVDAGHEVPAFQPAAAYRITEFLLGRVDSLQSTVPLGVYPNVPQPDKSQLGRGSARLLGKGPSCKW